MEQLSERHRGEERGGSGAEAIVDYYEGCEVAEHAFFLRLRDGPVDLGAIWLLMANLHASISQHFVPWLAKTISRIGDRRIASFLAKQLNDELGCGEIEQVHSLLLERFVAALRPWARWDLDDRSLAPAQNLVERGAQPFWAADVHEAVGALMVGEIFAKKMDICVGNEIRRQSAIAKEALIWLELHEALEVSHADDSAELARFVPRQGPALAAAFRGAEAQWQALWLFLDEVDERSRISSVVIQ